MAKLWIHRNFVPDLQVINIKRLHIAIFKQTKASHPKSSIRASTFIFVRFIVARAATNEWNKQTIQYF